MSPADQLIVSLIVAAFLAFAIALAYGSILEKRGNKRL
jgi:hypothetical protein